MILANQFSNSIPRVGLIKLILIGVLFLIPFVFNKGEVEARATSEFPNSTHYGSNNGVMAVSSIATPSPCTSNCNGLNAREVSFKVFKQADINQNVTATLVGACTQLTGDQMTGAYSGSGGSGTLNGRISVRIYQSATNGTHDNIMSAVVTNFNGNNGSEGCFGSDLRINMPRAAFTTQQQNRYGNRVETAIIAVDKADGPGLKHYKVRVDGIASVTFDDLGAGEGGKSYTPNYPGYTAFALDQLGPPPQESDYNFDFVPDCNYDTGRDVWLKWSDADDGPGQGNYDNNIWWRLSGGPSGGFIDARNPGPNSLGGQGWSGASRENVGKLMAETKYTWTWSGVNHNNGVQLWMPFSEGGELADCNSVTEGGIGTVTCDAIRGWFFYPYDRNFKNFRARIQYRLNPGSGAWQDFPNDTGATSPVDKDFGAHPPSAGNQFRVEPQDLRNIFRNKSNHTLEFKLSARNLNSGELYENVDFKVETQACPNERRAACTVTGNQVPGLPANSGNTVNVVAGRAFNLNGVFRNTGGYDLYAGPTQQSPNPTDRHNYGLRFHNTGPWQWGKPEWALFAANPNGWVEAGDSRPIPINDLMAPGAPGTYSINVEPDHFGWGGSGGFNITACPVTINVYEEYVFQPGASRGGDVENPSTIVYTSTVSQEAPNPHKAIPATSYYALHRNGAQVDGPHTDGERNYQGNSGNTRTYTLTSPTQFGDQFCAVTYMKIGAGNTGQIGGKAIGYRAPNGAVIAAQDGVYSDCYRVQNRPYVRAYGGDVAAGGGFENIGQDSCGNTDSRISTYLRPLAEQNPASNKSGSGSQLAAMALGNISGFTSASMRTADPLLSRGLTFGHDNSPIAGFDDSLSPQLGGNMSGNGWCVPDFFQSTQFPDGDTKDVSASTGAINVGSGLADGHQTVRNIDGSKLTLTSSGLYNRKHTVYVDGDVFIRDNIMYNTNYAAGTSAIPSFTLVVRGNIYVENDVTQLDGLYIAQPRDGSPNSGRIYTCANAAGNAILDGGGLFSLCGAPNPTNPPRLTVNGAFIAQRVILNRTGLTLRNSTFREGPADSKAAEIFSFNPEIYLSPPVFRPNSTPTSGDYDYISVLAPTL
jgi:hypothetical protein